MNSYQAPAPYSSTRELSRRDLLRMGGLASTAALMPPWLVGCGGSDSPLGYQATIADARSTILKVLEETGTPSVSVALVDRERLIWAEAFGVIDKGLKTPPSTETLFCIGSCSKMIATIATLILAERGLLELDQPLIRYLPEFSMADAGHRQITVRMLINHSAGFPGTDYRNSSTAAPFPEYYQQVLKTLASANLKHPPGAMSCYSNDGFTLIQALVEALTQRSYVDFVKQEIFVPLGMTHSRYATEAFASGTFAPGFDGETSLGQEFMNAYASGGLYTTPTDMGRLGLMLLGDGELDGKRILQPSSVQAMARDQTVGQSIRPVIMTDAFGLGWDAVRQGGLAAVGITAWHKGGATANYTAEFAVLPDEGLVCMIMGASLNYRSLALTERILLNALVERGRIAALPAPWTKTPPPDSASTGTLGELEGVYAAYDRILRIKVRDDRTLELSRYGQSDWVVSPELLKLRSDGTFSSDEVPAMSYQPVKSAGQEYWVLRVPYGYGHYRLECAYVQKITPRPALSAVWLDRVGRRWIAVNEQADSVMSPILTLKVAPDCPGYLLASAGPLEKTDCILDASASDQLASMCLKIPYIFGRDLDDVVVEIHDGEEWLRMGGALFRAETTVLPLRRGVNSIAFGAEGYAEWRSIDASGAVQTLTFSGINAWKLYDSNFTLRASGNASHTEVPADAGQLYLLLYAHAEASVQVE